jgi:hypothetical protein
MSGLQMKYFVLKPDGNGPHAEASRAAMRAYADSIEETNPAMAQEILGWIGKAEFDAQRARVLKEVILGEDSDE